MDAKFHAEHFFRKKLGLKMNRKKDVSEKPE